MAMTARLRAVPTEEPNTVQFQLLFPAPRDDRAGICGPASLQTGDGATLDLGLVCAPTMDTWVTEHTLALAEHAYADTGPYVATLTWGDLMTSAIVEKSDPDLSIVDTYPVLMLFKVWTTPDKPMEIVVEVGLGGLRDWHRVRIDGGAGNIRWWTPLDGETDAKSARGEWHFEYRKPGPYRICVDLVDVEDYRLAPLGVFPLDIAPPLEDPDSAKTPQPPVGAVATGAITAPVEVGQVNANLPAWLPFQYVRPVWAWARTYTQPGGIVVSRYLALGTYLAVRQEVEVGGQLWYQTGSYDWIPASATAAITPSTLQGVEIGDPVSPPPPPPPPTPPPPPVEVRRGVVVAAVLNVRSGPGANYAVVGQLRYNSEVLIYEETPVAGVAWFRIGSGRWVHSGWIRLIDAPPPVTPPGATRQGVVTAHVLNVRAKPGVAADNPPVGKLLYGARVTICEDLLSNGATWYRIGVDRWVHGGWIRLLPAGQSHGGDGSNDSVRSQSGVWNLPVGWVISSSLHVRAEPGIRADNPVIDVVQHNQPLAILDSVTVGGQPWYRIGDGRWVYGSSVGVARLRPRPSAIRSDERWVGVNLRLQTAVAYEGDRPVYAALTATGMAATPTVQGIFRTWWRLRSRKMAGGSAATGGYYYLEEVPWTCYFYSGYALHAAYWHDAFGRPRSHGCINLSPYDAWWIFQWSEKSGPDSPAVYVYWE